MAQRFFQFALDLFGPDPAVHAVDVRGVEKLPALEQKAPLAQSGRPYIAIENIAGPVSVAPIAFRHPRATCEVLLDGGLVAFELRRAKRRTIGFVVGAEGLAVSAPKSVPLHEIDAAVQRKSGWIVKKLHETRERHLRLEAARIEWKDGATIPYLGEPVRMSLTPLASETGLQSEALGEAAVSTLRISLARDAAPEQMRLAVQTWLKQQARQLFTNRLDHFAPQLNVQWKRLGLSSAATRWGSASANGAIRLNWRLMHFSPALIDYVVVHELSHLRVMDHSPRFWATVGSVAPDFALLRRQLREAVAPCWHGGS